MIHLKDHLYDQRGTCPDCGAGLTPVLYYSAFKLGTDVTRRNIDMTTRVKTTTTHYGNITPRYAGWCEDCARRDWEAKEEARAQKRPNPAALIVASLVLAVGLAGLARMIITGESTGLPAAIGVIALMIGLIAFPWTLTAFLKKHKLHAKYASGWREPFTIDMSRLSASVAYTLNKGASGNQTFLSTGEVERMQH